jgi:Ca-activated chloride channel family protein
MQNDFEKLSLKKIDIAGKALGKFATFCAIQEYINNSSETLEVTYSFPLSASATVTGFTAKIGDKTIRGKVMEKEKAEKEYQKAMLMGNSAYMMTKEESNIFKMNIGKIAVGETVKVKINFIDTLEITDNQIRIMIPTLVPPRYKSKTTARLSHVKNEVEYRGNISIEFDKDMQISDIESKTHSIRLEHNMVEARNIRLDRDFALDVKLAEQVFSKGYYGAMPNGNKIAYLSFMPEFRVVHKENPKDYVFVIDHSGSMMGEKIEQTKEAVIKCLKNLKDGDRFNIVPFGFEYELYSTSMVEYNSKNFNHAKSFIINHDDMGGTELFEALKAAILLEGREKIIFLFTDGQVGNEGQIAEYVRQHIGKDSLFVFGIDSSINKNGLTAIAEAGRGKVEFIVHNSRIKDSIARQFARVASANLFEVRLDAKNNKVVNKIEKQRALFDREFYDVLVETDKLCNGFTLCCTFDEQTLRFDIPLDKMENCELPLHKIYAAEKIRQIEKYINARPHDRCRGYKEQIAKIAIEHGIDSRYTAFIAINERDEKIHDIPVLQDTVLEAPSGWDNNQYGQRRFCMSKEPPGLDEIIKKIQNCLSPSGGDSNQYGRAKATLCTKASMPTRIAAKRMPVIEENDQKARDNLLQRLSFKMIATPLFRKIQKIEQKIKNRQDYKALYDRVFKQLQPHFQNPSSLYRELFNRIKVETPMFYALIEAYLKK